MLWAVFLASGLVSDCLHSEGFFCCGLRGFSLSFGFINIMVFGFWWDV